MICSAENALATPAACRVVARDPRAAFHLLLQSWLDTDAIDFAAMLAREEQPTPGPARVHETAVIEHPVILGAGAEIGPHAVVKRGTIIGAGAKIRAGAVIGDDGIAPHRTVLGERLSQPHVGIVVIADRNEIGSNAVVLRALLGATRIGADTIIGNLSNIGHGAVIGEAVWMSVGCLIGGHSVVGERATLGMGTSVKDNVTLGDGVSVAMGSTVMKSAPAGANLFGAPAKPMRVAIKAGPARCPAPPQSELRRGGTGLAGISGPAGARRARERAEIVD